MEPIGFAFGVLGPLESVVRDLKQRYKNHKEAPRKLEEIQLRFQSCHGSLSSMASMFEEGWPRGFPQESKGIWESDFSRIRDLANSCEKQLKDLQQLQFSVDPGAGSLKRGIMQARRATRTNRVMEALRILDEDSVKIGTFTRHLYSLLGLAHQMANLAQPLTFEIDAFVSICNVPRPSGHEFLEFSSSTTPEGQIKYLLLSDSCASEQVTAALGGGRTVPVPGVLGMGGVGKTSALIGLGYDADIRNHFSDGVHFLLFGQQAAPAEIIAGVAGLVRDSGGSQKAKDVASCSKLGDAVHKAALWFSRRTCLFLCDDLWRSEGRPHGFLPDIRHLLDTSASSKMVISTRDRAIAEVSSHQVLFEPKIAEGEIALCIFLRHAGLALNAVKECDESAKQLSLKVLAFCGGLPIALAVVGRLLRRHLQPHSNDLVSALRRCLIQLEKGIAQIGDTSVGTYSSFNATIRASLNFLEKERLGRGSSSFVAEEKTIPYLFEALCVMKNQARLPIAILHKLWDLPCDESILVIEKLADLNIVAQNTSEFGAISISAHDLVLAYSKDVARRAARETMWHRKLLNCYIDSGPEMVGGDHPVDKTSVSLLKSPRPWWDVESDGYIHKNVSWHLKNSGLVAELEGLLTDMRWAKHRVNEGGILELENDIDALLGTLTNVDNTQREILVRQEVLKDFQLLRKSLRLSWSSIHRNPRELGFQLYSRLSHRKHNSEMISKYLKSIEEWNEKPWLRPWRGTETDNRLVAEIGVTGRYAVAWSSDNKRILYGRKDLVVFNVARSEEECRIRFEHRIASMSVAGRGKFVALGSREGTVHRWDLETNSQVGETLRKHSGWVHSVGISGDGRIMISGAEDKTVRLWQFEDDKVILRRRKKFRRGVVAVSISENGNRAASASGRFVTVWDTPGMRKLCSIERCSGELTCIALSRDGQHLVSGSSESVRLWTLEGNDKIGHRLFKSFDSVNGVSMSADGCRVAAIFDDGRARVWEMSTRIQIGPPFDHGGWGFEKVALNGTGSRLLLSTDENVSVWDVSEDADGGNRDVELSDPVKAVAYSQETNMIVSLHKDKTLRLWDADTGLKVGHYLSLPLPDEVRSELYSMSGNGEKFANIYTDLNRRRYLSVWDVHEWREIGKIRTDRCSGLWISRNGKYVISKSWFVGKMRIWDASTLAEIVTPRNESLRALENATSRSNKLDDERGLVILGTDALIEMDENRCTNRFESATSRSTAGKIKIRKWRDIVLMNQDKEELVLGSLSEDIRYNAWVVFQNSRGENILATGGSSGNVHWFTLEIE